MYDSITYNTDTTQKNASDSFRRNVESIRRDLNDLRNSLNSTSCLLCSRQTPMPRIESTISRSYHSAYEDYMIKTRQPSVTFNPHISYYRPEVSSPWDSSWIRNEHHYQYPYKPWTVSRYVP